MLAARNLNLSMRASSYLSLIGLKDRVVPLERLAYTLGSFIETDLSVFLGNWGLAVGNVALKASIAKGVADSVL